MYLVCNPHWYPKISLVTPPVQLVAPMKRNCYLLLSSRFDPRALRAVLLLPRKISGRYLQLPLLACGKEQFHAFLRMQNLLATMFAGVLGFLFCLAGSSAGAGYGRFVWISPFYFNFIVLEVPWNLQLRSTERYVRWVGRVRAAALPPWRVRLPASFYGGKVGRSL